MIAPPPPAVWLGFEGYIWLPSGTLGGAHQWLPRKDFDRFCRPILLEMDSEAFPRPGGLLTKAGAGQGWGLFEIFNFFNFFNAFSLIFSSRGLE